MIAMTKNIDAIYEQGIFRPLEPVEFKDHEHVRLTVESRDTILYGLIDHEYAESCARGADTTITLERLREISSKMSVPLTETVIAERNER